jgi:hypothetical protein
MNAIRHLTIASVAAVLLVLHCSGCKSSPKQKLSLSCLGVTTNGIPTFNVTYQMEQGERVCPNDAFMTSSILLDGIARHPPMDGLCGMECPSYPENTRVRFPIALDTYCYLREDESERAPSGAMLSQGKHWLVIEYAGHRSEAQSFTVKAGKKQNRDR